MSTASLIGDDARVAKATRVADRRPSIRSRATAYDASGPVNRHGSSGSIPPVIWAFNSSPGEQARRCSLSASTLRIARSRSAIAAWYRASMAFLNAAIPCPTGANACDRSTSKGCSIVPAGGGGRRVAAGGVGTSREAVGGSSTEKLPTTMSVLSARAPASMIVRSRTVASAAQLCQPASGARCGTN